MTTEHHDLLRIAKTGYEAYAAKTDWKNFRGDPMPQWDDLSEAIRWAWEAAAQAMTRQLFDELVALG